MTWESGKHEVEIRSQKSLLLTLFFRIFLLSLSVFHSPSPDVKMCPSFPLVRWEECATVPPKDEHRQGRRKGGRSKELEATLDIASILLIQQERCSREGGSLVCRNSTDNRQSNLPKWGLPFRCALHKLRQIKCCSRLRDLFTQRRASANYPVSSGDCYVNGSGDSGGKRKHRRCPKGRDAAWVT